MASSDSEEFESADENFNDYSDENKSKPIAKSNTSYPILTKVASSSKLDNNNKKDTIECTYLKSEEPKKINEIITEDSLEIKNQNIICPKSFDNFQDFEIPTLHKDIKQDYDQDKNKTNKPTSAIENKEDNKFQVAIDEEGWDFDDWNDNENKSGEENKVSENVQEINVAKTENDDENDWDFDDWGEEEQDKVVSLVKTIKPSTSLMENISKLMPSGGQVYQSSKSPSDSLACSLAEKITTEDTKSASGSNSVNWGWKPWGDVVSFISTATSHVSSVIESGIGVPDPAELARMHKKEEWNRSQAGINQESAAFKEDKSEMLDNFMHGVTNIGNRVIFSGLDTLEEIGKKTMNILQENDPGLLKKRALLGLDKNKPVLSHVLREAKDKSEETERNLKVAQKHQYRKQLHFESLFDEYHGLVHLEALEMLSKQSSLKLQSLLAPLSGRALDDIQDTLNEVKELCELPDQDNDDGSDGQYNVEELQNKLFQAVEDLDIAINFEDILQCWRESTEWLMNTANTSSQNIHDKALRCLAHSSALAVNKMHKLAELLLVKDRHCTANEADSLVQLTSTICWHLSGISSRFNHRLSNLDSGHKGPDCNVLITSIFLEGSNSISYIQNAFQLLVPILQMGAV